MKKALFVLSVVFSMFLNLFAINLAHASETSSSDGEEWEYIQLNTDFPWVWTKIKKDDAWNIFWKMIWWLMRLSLNFVVAWAFIAFLAAWIMISMSWVNQSVAWKWKDLIKKVILWIVLIWLSGLILHTINPNFFG